MDYLEQERTRGITIRAATTSFRWKGLGTDNFYQINLIDTPGHVDFTAEVERSLRVCDGAIGIFDAMQGVETQTETVWQQANRFNIPRLGFINKLDRGGADIDLTVKTIKEKLKSDPLLINIPVGEDTNFQGIIDLPSMMYYRYIDDLGKHVEVEDWDKNHSHFEKAMAAREQLIEKLAEYDEILGDKYLLGEHISEKDLILSLKTALKTRNTVALHWGSALKNRGIQPLLENVINLLPSPHEKESVQGMDYTTKQKIYRFPNAKDKLCAFAFKVVADPLKGLITFFRVYSGSLKNRSKIINSKTGEIEKVTQLMRMTADQSWNIEELGVGDIGAIVGVQSIRSGDTFIQENDSERIILSGVSIPPPVFFCSIEPDMSRDQKELEKVLRDLSFEDPSITVTENEETGQLQISGMGELHLEILKDRIELDYGIKTNMGTMRVAFRESLSTSEPKTFTIEKTVGNRQVFAELTLAVESIGEDQESAEVEKVEEYHIGNLSEKTTEDSSTTFESTGKGNKISKDYLRLEKKVARKKVDEDMELKRGLKKDQRGDEYEIVRSLDTAPREFIEAIIETIHTTLESGPLLGYPVVKAKIKILDGKWSSLRSDELTFKEWAARCIKELFKNTKANLLEPYMKTEIEIPDSALSDVLSNITGQKGGKILGIHNVKAKFTNEIDIEKRIVKCLVPLSQIIGYSKYLRSVTKGEGKFIMTFSHFQVIQEDKQKEILDNPFL
jgi:elongation factor G